MTHKKLKKMAKAMAIAYREEKDQGKAVITVAVQFSDVGVNLISSMWLAIDAYVNP